MPSSRCSTRSGSATRRSVPTRRRSGACSRSAPRKRARRPRRRSRPCTSAWGSPGRNAVDMRGTPQTAPGALGSLGQLLGRSRMTRIGRLGAVGALVLACLVAAGTATARVQANGAGGASVAAAAPDCHLSSARGDIKHVIYIQFDNTHFLRDNANVPSDLEQMPHLLNFITNNGTLMTNDHTALISHTATGILTSLTGVYPDRMGQPVSNSFRYFKTDGTTRTGVSFAYWTAPLFDPAGSTTDTTPEMIDENGKIAPAPWVPYTRAGCDVGAVATANTVLENTAIDIPTVFGAGSPEAAEVTTNPGQAFADFVGVGVHCAEGSSLCSAAN